MMLERNALGLRRTRTAAWGATVLIAILMSAAQAEELVSHDESPNRIETETRKGSRQTIRTLVEMAPES